MEKGPYPVVMSNGIGGYHSQYRAKGPGVVTGRSGTIGKLHYIEDDYWPHNTSLWVTSFNGNYPKFVYHLYQLLDLSHYGTGSGVPTLNRNDVHDAKVFIPSLDEQKQISKILDTIDSLITLHQRKYEKLITVKKSMLEKMFPRDGSNNPEIRFTGFTDRWEQRKYGDVMDLLSGQDFAPSDYNDEGFGMPYMTGASCIQNGQTMEMRWTPVPKCIAEKGDVLLVCKGSGYGTLARLTQEKAHIARQFMALKCKTGLNNTFNYYLAESVVNSIKTDARGLIAGIDRSAVLRQNVVLPKVEEQQRIGAFFNNLDNLITLHHLKLEKLKNIKQSLLQNMFV